MKRRTLLAASAALAANPLGLTRTVQAQATNGRAKIVLWHAMTGPLAETLNLLVNGFNISQKTTEVTAVFKGTYADTLTASIAAFRAGRDPGFVVGRDLLKLWIVTYGRDFGTANCEFRRHGTTKTGRQSHTWMRTPEGWRIVAAHVSFLGEATPMKTA